MLDKDTRTVAARIEVRQCRRPPEARDVRHRHHRSGGREARSHCAARRSHRAAGGQADVFVFEQGAYEAREVEPGERIAGRTVLKSGVKPGDQVVTEGAYALKARKLKSQLGHGH
jgi:cobalt-zinc-cadmium efflux system membrane fusion protein